MIEVYIPGQKGFEKYKKECKSLYEKVQNQIGDDKSFNFIIHCTYFFLFVSRNRLIGGIYYFIDEDGKLFLNGFANRKMHELNLECLKMSTKWFKGKIYAFAQNRASALCLLKCGFKRTNGQEFVYCSQEV